MCHNIGQFQNTLKKFKIKHSTKNIDEHCLNKKNNVGSWNFSLYNVYGRENAYRISFQDDPLDNSKTQRLGTCNTLESLVVSSKIAEEFLPRIYEKFVQKNIEIRGCKRTKDIIGEIKLATDQDYFEEYLGPYISCIVVDSLEEAINHINKYSSKHTEAIITDNEANGLEFIRSIDSSSVMINASTRFADGFEYGLGAEIGISTDKIHARGPVGLEGLTSLKYIVFGQGEIRS